MPREPRALLLDIGNSAIKVAWSDGTRLLETRRYRVRSPGDVRHAAEDLLSGEPFGDVVYASVNPPISDDVLQIVGPRAASVYEAGRNLPRGMPVKMDRPDQVGTDRTATALAAYESLKSALVVVDFGSAITFDCVDDGGAFLGGVICPGISMMASAMERDTALLPAVEIAPAKGFLGRSTEEAMISGVYHAAVAATNGILRGLMDEFGAEVPVVATGGDAEMIAPACPSIREVRPHLSLEGLLITYRRALDGQSASHEE